MFAPGAQRVISEALSRDSVMKSLFQIPYRYLKDTTESVSAFGEVAILDGELTIEGEKEEQQKEFEDVNVYVKGMDMVLDEGGVIKRYKDEDLPVVVLRCSVTRVQMYVQGTELTGD